MFSRLEFLNNHQENVLNMFTKKRLLLLLFELRPIKAAVMCKSAMSRDVGA